MEHLLVWSKCSIFHNIFKYMIFQRREKALSWSKGLNTNKWCFAGGPKMAQHRMLAWWFCDFPGDTD